MTLKLAVIMKERIWSSKFRLYSSFKKNLRNCASSDFPSSIIICPSSASLGCSPAMHCLATPALWRNRTKHIMCCVAWYAMVMCCIAWYAMVSQGIVRRRNKATPGSPSFPWLRIQQTLPATSDLPLSFYNCFRINSKAFDDSKGEVLSLHCAQLHWLTN